MNQSSPEVNPQSSPEQFNKDQEIIDRREIVRIVEVGQMSKHWKLIECRINGMIKNEERYLDTFKNKGLTAKDIVSFNRVVDQIYFMKKILNINNDILSENKSLIDKLAELSRNKYSQVKSFFDLS